MAFGIDTFKSHLDLIPTIYPGGDFFSWNDGARPVFAGRNFLGGDFLWGHGEATNALQNPSPEALENLIVSLPLIAPIQAPLAGRQQVTGPLGYLCGEIDADAICNRLRASILCGEFNQPERSLIYAWLSVDPAVPFSVDYWAGWSDRVNNFSHFVPVHIGAYVPVQPFRACILCNFSIGITGKLQPDAQVIAAIATSASNYKGSNTTCYALWADTEARPPLDWSVFSGTTMPLLWRFSYGFRNDAGAVVNNLFDVDAVNPGAGLAKATDFMLVTQRWQPNLNVSNLGFSSSVGVESQTECLSTAEVPRRTRAESCGSFTMTQGPVYAIGRYIRAKANDSIGVAEARAVSAKHSLQLFTVFERGGAVAGVGGPTEKSYYNPIHQMGRRDAEIAFAYCADVLHQPPNTHVFFAIDRTPDDDDEAWIRRYVEFIKEAYDAYLATHPNRPYLIGIYGSGRPLRWCYELGIANGFWQAGSMCQIESAPPRWPWPHATRLQYTVHPPFDPKICSIGGQDLDADWGDGGTWSLADPLAQELEQRERLGVSLSDVTFGNWGNLVIPLPPLP